MAEDLKAGTGASGVLVLESHGLTVKEEGALTESDAGRVHGLAKAAERLFEAMEAIDSEESEHGEGESDQGAKKSAEPATVTVQTGSLRIVKTAKLTLVTV